MATTAREDTARRKTIRRQPRLRPSISPSRPRRLGVGESYRTHPATSDVGARDVRRERVQQGKPAYRTPRGPTRDTAPAAQDYHEKRIVRGKERPRKPGNSSPEEQRRYNREKRIYGRGKQARDSLRLPVGDHNLDTLKDVPSHVVREFASKRVNENITHVQKQIDNFKFDTDPYRYSQDYIDKQRSQLDALKAKRADLKAQRTHLQTKRLVGARTQYKRAIASAKGHPRIRKQLKKQKQTLRTKELSVRGYNKLYQENRANIQKRSEEEFKRAHDIGDGNLLSGFGGQKQKATSLGKDIVVGTAKDFYTVGKSELEDLPSALRQTGGNPLAAAALVGGKAAYKHPGASADVALTLAPGIDVVGLGGKVTSAVARRLVARAGRTIPARIGKGVAGLVDRASVRAARLRQAEDLGLVPKPKRGAVSAAEKPRLTIRQRLRGKRGEPKTRELRETPRRPGEEPQTLRGNRGEAVRNKELDIKSKEIADYEGRMAARIEKNPRAKGGMTQKHKQLLQEYADMHADLASKTDRLLKAPTKAVYETSKKTLTGTKLLAQRYAVPAWVVGATSSVGVGYDLVRNKGHETNNIFRDARDLTVGFPYAMYVTGHAGFEAAKGNTSEVETLAGQLWDTDPVALAIQGRFDEALKSANDRPFSAALSLLGWGSVVGRVGGVGFRSMGALSKFTSEVPVATQLEHAGSLRSLGLKAGEYASQKREPLRLGPGEGEKVAQQFRRYSPNLAIKRVQVRADKAEAKAVAEAERTGKSIPKKYVAGRQLAALFDVRNSFATFDLTSRASVGKVEKDTVTILSDLHKSNPGAEEGFILAAKGLVHNPDLAEADLNGLIRDYEIQRDINKVPGDDAKIAAQIDNLESLRDSGVMNDPVTWDALKEFAAQEKPRQKKMVELGVLSQAQADAAPYIDYFVKNMGGVIDTSGDVPKWILPRGNKVTGALGEKKSLTLAEVKAYAKSKGLKGDLVHIASRDLLSDKEGDVTLGAYIHELESKGELVRRGTFDASAHAVVRQAIRSQRNIDKANFIQHISDRYIAGDEAGKEFDKAKDARQFHRENENKFDHNMVPIKIVKRTDAINQRGLDVTPFKDLNEMLAEATKAEGTGKFGLIPEFVKNELDNFIKVENSRDSIIRKMNREFKGSVLPFSPKWHFGNIVDMGLRMFMEGVTPLDYANGRNFARYLKKNDVDLYNEFIAQIAGGHLTAGSRSVLFKNMDALERAQLTAAQRTYRLLVPNPKNKGGAINTIYRNAQKGSFHMGQFFERQARYATAGKHQIKLLDSLGDNWMKSLYHGKGTLEDLALLLQDSNHMKYFGHSVVKTLGDYTNMSPGFRKLVNTWIPFGLWARASAKWVLTLPFNHPIKTAFFSAMNQVTAAERAKWGLRIDKNTKNVLPAFMFGAIPSYLESAGERQRWYYRTQQYTSFGPTYNYLDNAMGFLGPEFSGAYGIFSGYDWTGHEIINKKTFEPLTAPQRAGLGISSLMETMIYPLSIAHRLIVHGTPSNRSAVLAELGPYRSFFNLAKPEKDWYKLGAFDSARAVDTDAEDLSVKDVLIHWGNPLARTPYTFQNEKPKQAGSSTSGGIYGGSSRSNVHNPYMPASPTVKKLRVRQRKNPYQ